VVEAEEARDAREALDALLVPHAADAEPEEDVLGDGEMREERVALEHHAYPALRGREPSHVLPRDHDAAGACFLEPRDEPERRRLSAARRPEQHEEPAFGCLEGDVLDGARRAPEPAHLLQGDRGHRAPSAKCKRRPAGCADPAMGMLRGCYEGGQGCWSGTNLELIDDQMPDGK